MLKYSLALMIAFSSKLIPVSKTSGAPGKSWSDKIDNSKLIAICFSSKLAFILCSE